LKPLPLAKIDKFREASPGLKTGRGLKRPNFTALASASMHRPA